jgi:hypothetical protein
MTKRLLLGAGVIVAVLVAVPSPTDAQVLIQQLRVVSAEAELRAVLSKVNVTLASELKVSAEATGVLPLKVPWTDVSEDSTSRGGGDLYDWPSGFPSTGEASRSLRLCIERVPECTRPPRATLRARSSEECCLGEKASKTLWKCD